MIYAILQSFVVTATDESDALGQVLVMNNQAADSEVELRDGLHYHPASDLYFSVSRQQVGFLIQQLLPRAKAFPIYTQEA